MDIIEAAIAAKRSTLSEHQAKQVLAGYGIPVTEEELVQDPESACRAAARIGFPIALKACGSSLLHKTEHDAVILNLGDEAAVRAAAQRLLSADIPGREGLLVQRMVPKGRELLVGMTRDRQFGPVVAFGLGGILTEVLRDVSFRVAPLRKVDALEMMSEIRGARILDEFRGMPEVDRGRLADILVAVGRLAMERPEVVELDINPLMVGPDGPIAVDALIRIAPPKK